MPEFVVVFQGVPNRRSGLPTTPVRVKTGATYADRRRMEREAAEQAVAEGGALLASLVSSGKVRMTRVQRV